MMKYYELINGELLVKKASEKKSEKKNNHLVVKAINSKNYLVINTYKNKVLIVPQSVWDDPQGIPENLYGDVQTYESELHKDFEKIESESLKEYAENKMTTFILAITYACNLRCSYCYQQHNDKLKRSTIQAKDLLTIFNTIEEYHRKNPDRIIELGLFGGEPLLPATENIIDEILEFCKKNKFGLHITTNGTYLEHYLKKIIINRKLITSINTTVDSVEYNEQTRSYTNNNLDNAPNDSGNILKCVKILLNYNVFVNVSTNIDNHNLHQLKDIATFFIENGFGQYKHFRWDIGRVDDRMYETNYPEILEEVDILKELETFEIPSFAHAAFIKTGYNLCKKINRNYQQSELRGIYNYCWTSSSMDHVFYIDNELNTYRCTYTVGRTEKSIFKFNLENLEKFQLYSRTYLDYEECCNCDLGGYCAGGCQLSHEKDSERQCRFEKKAFERLVDEFFIPIVKGKLKIVEKEDYEN